MRESESQSIGVERIRVRLGLSVFRVSAGTPRPPPACLRQVKTLPSSSQRHPCVCIHDHLSQDTITAKSPVVYINKGNPILTQATYGPN